MSLVAPRLDHLLNHRIFPHLAPVPDLDISQYHGTRTDQYPATQLRVSVPAALPRPPQSNAVQECAVIAHDGCLSEHDARGVVDHHALSDDTAGVDVHAEHFRHPALDGQSERFPLLLPQNVPNAAGLQAEVTPGKPSEGKGKNGGGGRGGGAGRRRCEWE